MNDRRAVHRPLALLTVAAAAAAAAATATTNAFLPPTTSTSRHRVLLLPRDSNKNIPLLRLRASNDEHQRVGSSIIREEEESTDVRTRIDRLLAERRRELLSDASVLREVHPQQSPAAAANATITTTQKMMVRECLLSTRLSLPFLRRTKVGPSNLVGAGRGLFATEDISKGSVITCYPGDALLDDQSFISDRDDDDIDIDDDKHDIDFEAYEEEDFEDDFGDDFEDDDEEEVVLLWGAHVPKNIRWDEDRVFGEDIITTDSSSSDYSSPLTGYALSVDDRYSIMGHPELDDDPAYYGHFANDGAGHLGSEKKSNSQEVMGVEESIAAYVLKSMDVSNAMHKPLLGGGEEEMHMATMATRDIEAGEEIYVTYGPDYWLEHST